MSSIKYYLFLSKSGRHVKFNIILSFDYNFSRESLFLLIRQDLSYKVAIMYGFIVNTITVIAGSLLGLLAGGKLHDKYKNIVLKSLGLVTILIGLKMAIKTEQVLIVVGSLVFGGLIGQWLQIEERLEKLGEYLKKRSSS